MDQSKLEASLGYRIHETVTHTPKKCPWTVYKVNKKHYIGISCLDRVLDPIFKITHYICSNTSL